MTRNLNRSTPLRYVATTQQGVRNEEQKPVLGSFQVFVGDFVGPDDPANDPPGTSTSSPPWLNGFSWVQGFPVWFAHGVDGETDMGGQYDLVTGSPVSGDIAFMMPLEWAEQAPPSHPFAVELTTDVWTVAVQVINPITGAVRIFWPIVATPYP